MAMKTSSVPFNGTKEQEQKLQEVLEKYKDSSKSAIVAVLQNAQEIYGYLPIEVQTMIAVGLNVPLEEVYGVTTFYSQFCLDPKGKYNVSICLGTACYVKGAGDVYDKFQRLLKIKGGQCTADGKFSLEACRCIGACGLAPVLTVNDEVFGKVTVDDIDDILAKFQ